MTAAMERERLDAGGFCRAVPGVSGCRVGNGERISVSGKVGEGEEKVGRKVCGSFIPELSLAYEHCAFSKINIVPSNRKSLRNPGAVCEHEEGECSNIHSVSVRSKGIDPLQCDGVLDPGLDLEAFHPHMLA